MDLLRSLSIPMEAATALMRLKEPDSRIRVDIRSEEGEGHVTFLNDIEKDDMYKRWTSDVDQLLRPSRGRLPSIRKNLFTAVFALDAASDSAMAAADTFTYFLQNQVPVRMGALVLSPLELRALGAPLKTPTAFEVDPEEEEEQETEEAAEGEEREGGKGEELSHKVGVMFYSLKQLFGSGEAFRFLSACNEARPESGEFDSYMLSMMMMQVRRRSAV